MRRPIRILCLALAALGASASITAAAGGMSVGLNESRRIPLRGEAANVVVGDQTVADVTMTDAHSVIVMGRGYGATQLVVTDKDGRVLLASRITVPDNGHVTLFRGVTPTEFSCAGPACSPLATMKAPTSGAGDQALSPSQGPTSSGDQDEPAPMRSASGSPARVSH